MLFITKMQIFTILLFKFIINYVYMAYKCHNSFGEISKPFLVYIYITFSHLLFTITKFLINFAE